MKAGPFPFSVLMDMPLGALGVVAATSLQEGMPNDILFPNRPDHDHRSLGQERDPEWSSLPRNISTNGATLVEAALHAVRQRLRPILYDLHRLRARGCCRSR